MWAEVTDPAEAAAAVAAGVKALVAKGHEAGGRVGGTTTFVLLQQLLADPGFGLPVRAYGGIGPHTAAAAVAGGAAGVLVDVQLALTPEGRSHCPPKWTRPYGPWTAPKPDCCRATGCTRAPT